MNAFKRFIARVVFGIKARYEGARWSPDRSIISSPLQDARFDVCKTDRVEIMRKARWFDQNSALVNRIADVFEQYTVGAEGLVITPASVDSEWNQKALNWWNEWSNFADLVSLQSWGTLQSLIARAWLIDGEIFILKTTGESGRPRLQLIESHRVETPSALRDQEGLSIVDGIRIDATGRPTGYYVRTGSEKDGTYQLVSAASIIHVFEPSRPGQYRGISFLAPVINDLHDLDDLQLMEMRAAKDAAEKSNILETASGEFDESTLRRVMLNVGNQSGDGTTRVTESRTQFVQDAVGGRTIALKPGEKLTQFRSDRPSVITREYWSDLVSKVCAGVGVSKMLVYPWSIQGTVLRYDAEIASGFFRCRSAVLASAFRQVFIFVIGWAICNDRSLADPPANWTEVITRAPRAPNVDVGRNSAAMIAELNAGTTTMADICAPAGRDWRSVVRQRATELKAIDEIAKEFGLDSSRLAFSAAQAAAQSQPQDQPA